jgi:hypothetical protein
MRYIVGDTESEEDYYGIEYTDMTTTYINGKMQYKTNMLDWSDLYGDYFGYDLFDIETRAAVPNSLFRYSADDLPPKTREHIQEYEVYNPKNIPLIEGAQYSVTVIYFEDGEIAEILKKI